MLRTIIAYFCQNLFYMKVALNSDKNKIVELCKSIFSSEPAQILMLKADGSNRKIYRVNVDSQNFIAVIGDNVKENRTFISYTNSFVAMGLNVPQIIAVSNDELLYLQTDLGDETLFSKLLLSKTENTGHNLSSELKLLYEKVIQNLIKFQTCDLDKIDFNLAFPYKYFDAISIKWDLNYFKYNFLKLANIEFNEYALEQDFILLTEELIKEKNNYFLYRDFQSRNIMLVNNEPYFIDYQGGRLGALQYDLASLLFDAKADLAENDREYLLNFYLKEIANKVEIDESEFKIKFYQYALIRILQAMGAYGLRGLFEKKHHFLASINYAIGNLLLIKEKNVCKNYPEISNVIESLKASKDAGKWDYKTEAKNDKLKISIKSFSYKNGYPNDKTGNGGGFVFDCRAIENPGRYAEYKAKNGLDTEVQIFLNNIPESHHFMRDIQDLVFNSVEKYLNRNFENLSVNFGCTGGQHRSVYFAERLKKNLLTKFGDKIIVEIQHTNSENWVR